MKTVAKKTARKPSKRQRARDAEKAYDTAKDAMHEAVQQLRDAGVIPQPEPPKPSAYELEQQELKEGLRTLNEAWRRKLEEILEGIERIEHAVGAATRNLSVGELGCDCVLEEHAILELAEREIGEQWQALHVLLGGEP